jgi:hypothetical protein
MPKKRLLLVEFLRLVNSIDLSKAGEVKRVLKCGSEISIKIKKRLALIKKVG